jgi:hypothetical protein
MKTTFIRLSAFVLLFALMGAGCEKEDDDWIEIDPFVANTQLSTQLDLIFSKNNDCLQISDKKDTVLFPIFSNEDFTKIDDCNTIPEVDFGNYTLITGKIMVPSMPYNISAITLISNSTESKYKLNVSIDKCNECYPTIGFLYFWRLYPKLNSKYKFELLITENKKI